MDDHTHIRNVHPQTESRGGHHNLCLSMYEVQLPLLPLLPLCSTMQVYHREVSASELFVEIFDALRGGAVDDGLRFVAQLL